VEIKSSLISRLLHQRKLMLD